MLPAIESSGGGPQVGAASVGPVLGLADGEVRDENGEGREDDALEKALKNAGSAILEECENQGNLGSFPAQRSCMLAGS